MLLDEAGRGVSVYTLVSPTTFARLFHRFTPDVLSDGYTEEYRLGVVFSPSASVSAICDL